MSEETVNQQELSQLLQIRRDKLIALQEKGQDPFAITKFDQTHHSEEIRANFSELEKKSMCRSPGVSCRSA